VEFNDLFAWPWVQKTYLAMVEKARPAKNKETLMNHLVKTTLEKEPI
jgi:hypothetical protein